MANRDSFCGAYIARFGPFTDNPKALHYWGLFIDQIPDAMLDRLMAVVKSNLDRKKRSKPFLGDFESAWDELNGYQARPGSECATCGGTGSFSVIAWRDFSPVKPVWRLGYHKGCVWVSVPCDCQAGQNYLQGQQANYEHIRLARQWLVDQKNDSVDWIAALDEGERQAWGWQRYIYRQAQIANTGSVPVATEANPTATEIFEDGEELVLEEGEEIPF